MAVTVMLFSCGNRRSAGHGYMPDMTYSRAYETYAPAQERLNNSEAESETYLFRYAGKRNRCPGRYVALSIEK